MAKTTQVGAEKEQSRHPRDATAGGGPPVNGDHFAGDMRGSIERAFFGPAG